MPESYADLPPPPRPGYAPRLCTHGPIHYAVRHPAAAGIAWLCLDCGLAWRVNGRPVEEKEATP